MPACPLPSEDDDPVHGAEVVPPGSFRLAGELRQVARSEARRNEIIVVDYVYVLNMYRCLYMYVYIYIYRERERYYTYMFRRNEVLLAPSRRERERERKREGSGDRGDPLREGVRFGAML